eukprot:TRINITY_DN26039_c0_g1_i2.p1 TRINITY_DN26039_c0_g1~~TRINITY_DN26039_c0_g1_i2.p1  ORF type:complete len:778 (-),score=94.37 TRINITY_DN26039_c0_g1_i2:74-2407(-)
MKSGRWHNWSAKIKAMFKYFPAILLVLMYMMITEGIFKSILDSPLYGRPFKPDEANSGGGDQPSSSTSSSSRPSASSSSSSAAAPFEGAASALAPAVQPGVTTKQAKDAADKARSKFKNTAEMVCHSLANPVHRRCAGLMQKVAGVIQDSHTECITSFKKQMGCKSWHSRMACGEYVQDSLKRILSLVKDPSFLSVGNFAASSKRILPGHLRQELYMAEFAVDLCRAMYMEEYLTMSNYQFKPTYRFAGLLHIEEQKRIATLQWLRDVWDTLQELIVAARTDKTGDLQRYLEMLRWPWSQWTYEVFVALEEADFESVPPDVMDEIAKVFACQASSCGCEFQFQKYASDTSNTTNLQMGRCGRWYRSLISGVLEDIDRPSIVPTVEAKEAARDLKLDNNMFVASRVECTLDDAMLEDLLAKDPNGDGLELFRMIGIYTDSLVQSRPNLSKLSNTWLSLLAIPGCILWHSEWPKTESVKYVMGATTVGVVCVPCTRCRREGKNYLSWDFDSEPMLIPISNPAGWICSRVRPTPPEVLPPSAPTEISFELLQGSNTLLITSVNEGLPSFTVQQMKDLVDHFEIEYEPPKPNTALEVLALIAKWARPDISDADLIPILAKRKHIAKSRFETYIAENFDLVLDAADPVEMKDVMDEVEELKKLRARLGLDETAQKVKVRKPATAKTKAISLPSGDLVASKIALFLPQVKGCNAVVEKEWHHRLRIFYPRDCPPFSVSRNYREDAESKRLAVKSCLEWVWGEHSAVTQRPCPFDLERIAFAFG